MRAKERNVPSIQFKGGENISVWHGFQSGLLIKQEIPFYCMALALKAAASGVGEGLFWEDMNNVTAWPGSVLGYVPLLSLLPPIP